MLKGGMGIARNRKEGIDPKHAMQLKDKIDGLTAENNKLQR